MSFKVHTPPEKESDKPDFLTGLELETSENISHGMLKDEYEGIVLGYTTSDHKDTGKGYVTFYVKSKTFDGYFARTYKYMPSINDKGELYRILDHFGLLKDDDFDGMIAKRVKFELIYSQDQNQKYNYIENSDYIYVNFKVLTSKMNDDNAPKPTDAQQVSEVVEPKPETDHITCRACKRKVTNLLDHMEAGCENNKFLVE